jgi:hypothetical protein
MTLNVVMRWDNNEDIASSFQVNFEHGCRPAAAASESLPENAPPEVALAQALQPLSTLVFPGSID